MTLEQQQRALVQALKTTDGALPNLAYEDPLAIQRSNIYRNNRLQALRQTLSQHYPLINQLVGDDYFFQLVKHFIHKAPPQYTDLNCFGDRFADYLEKLQTSRPELKTMPYLVDLAQLEHACHCSYYAANRRPWPHQRFASLSLDQQEDIQPQLAEDIFLLNSHWPLTKISQHIQQDKALNLSELDLSLDLQDGLQNGLQNKKKHPEYFFVIQREHYKPYTLEISQHEFSILQLCQQRTSLQQLTRQHPESAGLIGRWIQHGWLDDFYLPETHKASPDTPHA
jgi:Putative DNA-binding domain